MLHNVYDFDKTIYDGDSSIDFYLYCLRRHPVIVLEIPRIFAALLQYRMKKCTKTRFKEIFFGFLKCLPATEKTIQQFWEDNEAKIKKWYLEQKEDADIIISASPEFLLLPICERLGVRLIATKMDMHTGSIDGENCRGEEKVHRFFEAFPDGRIKAFYSDSLSDIPLAKLAEQSFLVKGNKITVWKTKSKF